MWLRRPFTDERKLKPSPDLNSAASHDFTSPIHAKKSSLTDYLWVSVLILMLAVKTDRDSVRTHTHTFSLRYWPVSYTHSSAGPFFIFPSRDQIGTGQSVV